MDGRRSIVVPCAIGNAMGLIAKTAIRGTSEDANYGGTYMTFGEAINAAKSGKRIQREGWNGKAQYIELATCISYKNTKGEIVNCKKVIKEMI